MTPAEPPTQKPGPEETRPSPVNRTTKIRGSCLCGGVRFIVTGPFRRAGHCHCSRCRKHSGTAVSTQGRVARQDFRLLAGAELVSSYRTRGHDAKAFCTVCGSSLFGGDWPEGEEVSIRFGTLDDDPEIRPQYHTFVDSKASWNEITDDLPRHKEALPSHLRAL